MNKYNVVRKGFKRMSQRNVFISMKRFNEVLDILASFNGRLIPH